MRAYPVAHRARDGGDLIMTEGQHDDIPGFGHVLGHPFQVIVAQVKRHQVTHLEQVRRQPRVTDVVVTGIQDL